jgi:2,3-bisphosphoglycerate-dependent phosphoglycerate mutase
MSSVSATQHAPTTLVLLRHGESIWNRQGRFTGWTDVPLSARGIEQAERAGRTLAAHGYSFDLCFTSSLTRATETLRIVLSALGQEGVPIGSSWRLNERHYGALQGMTTWEAIRRFGPRAVLGCRRRYDAAPPPLDPNDPRSAARDPRFDDLDASELPRGESLRDTCDRVLPYWREAILPEIRAGKRVLIVSHRNTLSVLVKILDDVADRDAPRLKAPTGQPLIYRLGSDLRPLEHFYLRDGAERARPTAGTAPS